MIRPGGTPPFRREPFESHSDTDAAEGMLDDLATPQAGGHPVELRLVLQTRDPAQMVVQRERSGQAGHAAGLL